MFSLCRITMMSSLFLVSCLLSCILYYMLSKAGPSFIMKNIFVIIFKSCSKTSICLSYVVFPTVGANQFIYFHCVKFVKIFNVIYSVIWFVNCFKRNIYIFMDLLKQLESIYLLVMIIKTGFIVLLFPCPYM